MQFYRKALSRSAKIPESTFYWLTIFLEKYFLLFWQVWYQETVKRETAKILIAKYFTWPKWKPLLITHQGSVKYQLFWRTLQARITLFTLFKWTKIKALKYIFHFRRNVFCLCSSTPTSATTRPRRCARSCRTTSTTSKNFTRSFFGTRWSFQKVSHSCWDDLGWPLNRLVLVLSLPWGGGRYWGPSPVSRAAVEAQRLELQPDNLELLGLNSTWCSFFFFVLSSFLLSL